MSSVAHLRAWITALGGVIVLILVAGFVGYLATKKLRGSAIRPVVVECVTGD